MNCGAVGISDQDSRLGLIVPIEYLDKRLFAHPWDVYWGQSSWPVTGAPVPGRGGERKHPQSPFLSSGTELVRHPPGTRDPQRVPSGARGRGVEGHRGSRERAVRAMEPLCSQRMKPEHGSRELG